MILSGRRVTAKEGKELGFVNEVTSQEDLMPAAKRWAEMILECSPMSVRASKQAVYQGLDKSTLEDAINSDYPAVEALYESADFIEGPKAFSEKRTPRWTLE